MSIGTIIASVNMLLCVSAAIGYAVQKDWGRAVYWACAFGITYAATFMIKS